MAKMLYSVTMSLDGFIAGPGGDMSWLARRSTRGVRGQPGGFADPATGLAFGYVMNHLQEGVPA